ncbi:hypothetical protein ACMCNP_00565 [Candidatus Acidulodesulfobacterium sp. H_13]|uniref:hypothetical protein n=1 Tax=Candidatus Acidulodesulfobacterium sp. H_13 TaxID=3395470 RepID=UPI003AF75736
MSIPIPDIGAISEQIQSVETAAGSAFSALQGLAGTVGYAPGASGGPFFNPGPGLSDAMATVDKLTADISKMRESYQNIIINYDKLGHLVNSVKNAVNGMDNLNERINEAFKQIPQDLTESDISVSLPQNIISAINSENMEFKNLDGIADFVSPRIFTSGYSASEGNRLNKISLEKDSKLFTEEAIFNADGNSGAVSPKINCPSYDNGYFIDSNGNLVGGCTDLVNGFESDTASLGLYNAGISAARAHKAELEGDEFMREITGNRLKNSTNYYAYQSSVLTLIAEENAASLKNLGYIESQLKQMEISESATKIKEEQVGAAILPQTDTEPGLNLYDRTTI